MLRHVVLFHAKLQNAMLQMCVEPCSAVVSVPAVIQAQRYVQTHARQTALNFNNSLDATANWVKHFPSRCWHTCRFIFSHAAAQALVDAATALTYRVLTSRFAKWVAYLPLSFCTVNYILLFKYGWPWQLSCAVWIMAVVAFAATEDSKAGRALR